MIGILTTTNVIIKPLVKRYLNYDDVYSTLNKIPTGLIIDLMDHEEILRKVPRERELTTGSGFKLF